MHFGMPLGDERFLSAIGLAHQQGIRTFLTADVYGAGQGDELLRRGLAGQDRDSYCLVGAVGHDFYQGKREGSKGYPRFTDESLRRANGYYDYLRMATEKSLERCGVDCFDLLMLHNPDSIGYTSDAVWESLAKLREAGLTKRLGVAPGPANGFTLDLIQCLERFQGLVDWAMIILNPLEPWPGRLVLPAAAQTGTKVLTRVVDYGGLFHDDVKPGHVFGAQDHRTFRPAGWVEAGTAKLERMRPIAEAHGLTLLQLACLWNLQHPAVASVVPTLIQEDGPSAKSIETKISELANLPEVRFSEEEFGAIGRLGDNSNSMTLKGANPEHVGQPLPDRWSLTSDLEVSASRWKINPTRDLAGPAARPV